VTPADELDLTRAELARIDRALVQLMGERVRTARRTAALKRAAGLPTLDPGQEAAVVRRAGAWAREAALDSEAIREVFWRLVGLARRAQQEPEP